MLLPLGKRRRRDFAAAAAYLAGTLAGASLSALLAWLLAGFGEPLPASARFALLAAAGGFLWAAKHGPLAGRVRLPEARRQIPLEVFGRSLLHGALRFGFEMGTGMRTYVPSWAPYLLFTALVLVRPTLGQALAVACGFGLGRALPLMVQVAPEERLTISNDFLRGSDHRFAQTAAGLVVLAGALLLV